MRQRSLFKSRELARILQALTLLYRDLVLPRSDIRPNDLRFYSRRLRCAPLIALDNVSDPEAVIGEAQLAWLQADLKQHKPDTPIVALTHRPLFDLYPQWDWATRDAASVINTLMPFKNVTVFYGHIHQEHHHMTGHIAHHAAKSLIFPLPAPGSAPKRAPVPWDPAAPYKGLGFRDVQAEVRKARYEITELPI